MPAGFAGPDPLKPFVLLLERARPYGTARSKDCERSVVVVAFFADLRIGCPAEAGVAVVVSPGHAAGLLVTNAGRLFRLTDLTITPAIPAAVASASEVMSFRTTSLSTDTWSSTVNVTMMSYFMSHPLCFGSHVSGPVGER